MNANQRETLASARFAEEWSAGLRPGVMGLDFQTRRVGDRRSGQIKELHEN